MENHIRVKRLWQCVQMFVELRLDEHAHLSQCELCLKALNICVLEKTQPIINPTEKSNFTKIGLKTNTRNARGNDTREGNGAASVHITVTRVEHRGGRPQ